jgi:gliding motility-associated-like protein
MEQPGLYWLQAEYNANGCPLRDSINITQAPAVVFSLPADTVLCNNQTLLLNPAINNASYVWQNGSTQPQFTVTQPGQYWVKVTSINGCVRSDTINVSYVSAQQVHLGNDTSLCAGATLRLDAGVTNVQYLWNTGAVTQTIDVTQTGIYWVKVNNGNCNVTDSILVTFNLPPVVFLGKDTAVCANSTLTLNAGVVNASYLWQNGTTQSQFTVTQPGQYWLQVKLGGCTVADTINVTHHAVPAVNLGPDIQFCAGEKRVLKAPGGFVSYNWSTGSMADSITVNLPGNYWVVCNTAANCKVADTLRVLPLYSLPQINLGNDAGICTGGSKVLTPGNSFANYNWSNGSSAASITVTAPGVYWVTVTDALGCKNTDSITILPPFSLPVNFLPADTSICSYGNLLLKANSVFTDYLWSTGATTSFVNITQPGIYWLQVKDNNLCEGKDSIVVLRKECLKGLYVPTAFTPNVDGRNDKLKPYLFGTIQKFEFRIYNRYGQQIFYSTNTTDGWDGTVGAEKQNTGSFVWVCQYTLAGQAAVTERGMFTLIR